MTAKRVRLALIISAVALLLYATCGFFAAPALIKHGLVQHAEENLKHKLTLGAVSVNPFTFALDLNDFDLREPNGGALLSFKRLRVNFEASSVFRRAWHFAEITLEAPVLLGELRKDGSHNFAALLAALRDPKSPPEPQLPPLVIGVIRLTDGRIELADLQAGEGARLQLAPLAFELTELSSLPGGKGPYKLTARSAEGELLTWDGDIALNPMLSYGRLTLSGWKMATVARMLGSRVALERADGRIDARLEYLIGFSEARVHGSIKDFDLAISQLSVQPKGSSAPLLSTERFALGDVAVDFAKRTAAAKRLEIGDGMLTVEIGADQQSNWAALIAIQQAAARESQTGAIPSKPGDTEAVRPDAEVPWQIQVANVTVNALGLRRTDKRPGGSDLSLQAATLALALNAEIGASKSRIRATSVKGSASTAALTLGDQRLTSGPLDLAAEAIIAETSSAGGELTLEAIAVSLDKLDARLAADTLASQRIAVRAVKIHGRLPSEGSDAQRFAIDAPALEGSGVAARIGGAKHDVLISKTITVDAKSLAFDGTGGSLNTQADMLNATLEALSLRDPAGQSEVARIDRAEIRGGSLDSSQRLVALDRLNVAGGQLNAVIDRNGAANWAFGAGPSTDRGATPAQPTSSKPWRALVKSAELHKFGARYDDQRQAPALSIALTDVQSRARNLGTVPGTASDINIRGHIDGGGQFSADGRIDLGTLETDAKLKVDGLSLAVLQPMLASHARLAIKSAFASADGRVRYRQGKRAGADLVFEGSLGLDKVVVNETEPAQPFLSFSAFKASDAKLTLGPNRLDVADLRVEGMSSKLVIAEDQSINLPKVLRTRADPGKPAPTAARLIDTFPISIARTRIADSHLDFADLSLRPQFAARMHEMKGVITRISTDRTATAQLELDAHVDEFGSARIRGEIIPFAPRDYTDVDMAFRNIALTSLTPYSSKFAGYRIASGTLSMDLNYKIKNGALVGENKLVLDKLELGEKVDSPTAFNLPLELAVAILKDSNGRIDLGIPVTGSLDDPQFSYGALIWKAIGNVFARIITAPFRALAGLFGSGAEQLDAIEFDPGADRLLPPERQKLRTLADALDKRPQLKLNVKPAFAPEFDRAALQTAEIRHQVALRGGLKLAPGEDPGPIDFGNPRTQQAIEALFTSRYSDQAARELRARLQKSAAQAVEGLKSPDKAKLVTETIARAMTQQLIEGHPVDDAALAGLAKRRGEAIVQELSTAAKIDASRLHALPPVATGGSARSVPTSLDLSVSK